MKLGRSPLHAWSRIPWRSLRRPLLAFLLAPLVPALLYLAATSAFGGYRSADLALYIAQYAYLAALLGGLPMHVTLGRLGWVTLHDYSVFGVLLGVAAALVTARPPLDFSVVIEAGLAALAGAIAGGVFWLIARPDRSGARCRPSASRRISAAPGRRRGRARPPPEP